jgi:hypothetical protein
LNFLPSLAGTLILPISTSLVARIKGLNHYTSLFFSFSPFIFLVLGIRLSLVYTGTPFTTELHSQGPQPFLLCY